MILKNPVLASVTIVALAIAAGIFALTHVNHDQVHVLTSHIWCDQNKANRSGPLSGFTSFRFNTDGSATWKHHSDTIMGNYIGQWRYDAQGKTISVRFEDGSVPANLNWQQTLIMENNLPVVTSDTKGSVNQHVPLYRCDEIKR